MDVALFHEFIEVVKAGSFRKASLALHIDPSTLTRHIDHLEEELDTQLFLRENGKRTFELTSDGRFFLKDAAVIWSTYQHSSQHLSSSEWDKALRMCGAQESAQHSILIGNIMREFAEKGHGECLYLSKPIASEIELVNEVLSGRADCAMGYDFSNNALIHLQEDNLACSVIGSFPIYAVAMEGTLPQEEGLLSFESLRNYNFMHPGNQRYAITWAKVQRVLANRGIPFTFDPIKYSKGCDDQRSTIAIIPMDSLELQAFKDLGYSIKRIVDPEAHISIELLHRKNNPDPRIETIREIFSRHLLNYKNKITPR